MDASVGRMREQISLSNDSIQGQYLLGYLENEATTKLPYQRPEVFVNVLTPLRLLSYQRDAARGIATASTDSETGFVRSCTGKHKCCTYATNSASYDHSE